MAGLGRRTFAAGEVLTASNVMGYLQDQAVMSFAGTAARGSAIGTAASQGMTSFQQDTGIYETYHVAYGTAVGQSLGGRDSAGWYSTRKTDGLVPVIPTSAVATGGTGSQNSVGVVSFSGSTAIWLKGVFTSKYKKYRVVIEGIRGGGVGTYYGAVRIGDDSTLQSASYGGGFNGIESGYTAVTNLNDTAAVLTTYIANNNQYFITEMIIDSPAVAEPTQFAQQSKGFAPGNAYYYSYGSSHHGLSTAYSSIWFTVTGGTMTGTMQVFGYNDK